MRIKHLCARHCSKPLPTLLITHDHTVRNVLSSSFYRSTERSSNLTKVTQPEEVDGSKSQAEAMLPKSHRHAWTSLIPPLWFSCQTVWKYSIWVVVAGLTWSYWPGSWVSPQCVLQLKTTGSCLHWKPHMRQRPACLPLFSLHFRRRFCTKFLTYPAKGRSELWDILVYKYWWLSLLVQCSPASKLHHGAFQQRLVSIHNVRSLPAWEALQGEEEEKKKNTAQKLIGKLGQDTLAYLKLRRKCEYLHHTDLK